MRPRAAESRWSAVASIALVPFVLAACGGAAPRAAGGDPWAEQGALRVAVPVDGSPGRGADEPLVTLVVFSDFECPYCRAAAPILTRVVDAHAADVRLHFRHLPLPFHEHAELAAEAAEEARAQGGAEAFWRYHDLLVQGELHSEALVAHASRLGLDAQRFRVALRGHVHRDAVEADLALAEELGVEGTPTLFINGRPLLGVPPHADLDALVREEIALARQALARGIPRAEIYARVLAQASRTLEPEPAPQDEAPPQRALDENVLYAAPVDGAPQLGPAAAPVTIVSFSDFECPFCARALPILQALRERYPDRIRLVFRHLPLPFHEHAVDAALAAEAARAQRGDAGFWAMHDRLFANQDALSRADLERHAAELGLDVTRFSAALDAAEARERVDGDREIAMRLGVRGTPTFYVNGRIVQGAQPLPVFAAVVDDALERAEAELARGTPPERIYDALVRDGSDRAVWVEPDSGPLTDEGRRVSLPVPPDAPRRGAARPRLVVQMFGDFECPFCARVQPALERLLREFPDVQLVFRHYPLPHHSAARPAAIASIEVHRQLGDAGFWAYHALLYAHPHALGRADLIAYAEQVGADRARVAEAIDGGRHAQIIDADVAAVTRAGLRIGTPAFLIGERLMLGAQPYEAFARAVREELDAAGDRN